MAYDLNKISVLVVDDNMPMLEIVKSLLLTFGVGHVIIAQNGEIAYKRFSDYDPDIVIADWMMKPMDGISLTRRLRNDPATPNPYVPVILMTGFSERRRVFHARDAGVTEFLVKPFTARDLYRRLAQVIERPRQFVRSDDFFGPDRRRKSDKDYVGAKRRETDIPPELLKQQIARQEKEAHETLDRIRKQSGLGKGDPFEVDIDEGEFDLKEGSGSKE